MITKESLKGRGFEIRTYRIRGPKRVPESQKNKEPSSYRDVYADSSKTGTFFGPPFYFRSSPFLGLRNAFKSSHRSDKRIGVSGERE
jgi:hypothetical protein